jgi:hypothetical protein
LVEGGGEITLGHLDAIGICVATATDDAQCLAMLALVSPVTIVRLRINTSEQCETRPLLRMAALDLLRGIG